MTGPDVQWPHEDVPPADYLPRLYHRDGTPATEADVEMDWTNRLVAYSTLTYGPNGEDRAAISTIFLGLDHAISVDLDGGPILYETAVYEAGGLVFRIRSKTEPAARAAHASALIDLVAAVEQAPTPEPPAPLAGPSAYLADDTPENEGTPDERPDPPDDHRRSSPTP